jgi:hypothetical protein
MDWAGSLPQWLTASIAFLALVAALWSVWSQRQVARGRAAIDFFIKTEADKEMLAAHNNYKKACAALKKHFQTNGTAQQFAEGKDRASDYAAIRSYLNLHELLANGIHREVFDDHVSYHFWSAELARASQDAAEVIQYAHKTDGAKTYVELVKLSERWAERERLENENKFVPKQFGVPLPDGYKLLFTLERH